MSVAIVLDNRVMIVTKKWAVTSDKDNSYPTLEKYQVLNGDLVLSYFKPINSFFMARILASLTEV